MRPIVRGERPLDSDGKPIRYNDYPEARGELIARLGEYCSYCEMHLDASLAVEHVQPKRPPGALTDDEDRKLDWDNFLLACQNCNSTKGNQDIDLNDFFWPDRDNTFHALVYSEGGLITPRTDCLLRDKAEKTIRLTGLDSRPSRNDAASDRRWNNRREVWDIAERAVKRLLQNDTMDMRDQIVETALGFGYWSVWMSVFDRDADMRTRFIAAFSGTCTECFDSDGRPLKRPGGQC